VLADDHAVMRRGLRMLLDAEHDLEVLAEAGDIQSVFVAVRTHRPDVLKEVAAEQLVRAIRAVAGGSAQGFNDPAR
jgi:DNA-binding NarL/FixJ family response regulator